MTAPKARDFDEALFRAWLVARSHRQPPPFDAGWPKPGATAGEWVRSLLASGQARQVADALERLGIGDGPQAEALRAIAEHFRAAGIATAEPTRRGPRGRALTAERAAIVERERLALWLALYARELLTRDDVPEIEARCFAAHIVGPEGLPGADWRALAADLLTREGLAGAAEWRDWRKRFRDAVGARLERAGLPRTYLRGVAIELDT